jgi:hypothetical protein
VRHATLVISVPDADWHHIRNHFRISSPSSEDAIMIAKTFTPFLGVQPFAIMGFPGNDGAGMGHGLLV